MNGFWDVLARYVTPGIGILVGLVVAGYIVVALVGGVTTLGKWFTVDAYRVLRYERKEICPKCKQPFQDWVARSADQTYGPDQIIQGICSCGYRSIQMGNRRYADWADY